MNLPLSPLATLAQQLPRHNLFSASRIPVQLSALQTRHWLRRAERAGQAEQEGGQPPRNIQTECLNEWPAQAALNTQAWPFSAKKSQLLDVLAPLLPAAVFAKNLRRHKD